jgi:hypothetical protein
VSGEETEACDVAEKKVDKMEYQESCKHICYIKTLNILIWLNA